MTHKPAPAPPPQPSPPRRGVDPLLLAGLCLALLVLHAAWTGQNAWIRASDEAIHHLSTLRIHRALTGDGSLVEILLPSARELWRTGADQSLYYPPLTYLLSALGMFVLGDDVQAADLSQFLYVALLAVGLWWLARAVAGRRVAWAAVLLGVTAPPLITYGRILFLELPATAWLVWSVLALQRSRGLLQRGWVLGFALCAAAGLHTRWNFALFVAPPFLAALGLAAHRAWRAAEGTERGRRALALAGLTALPFVLSGGALALSSTWSWTPGRLLALLALWWPLHAAGVAASLIAAKRWPHWRAPAHGGAAMWLLAGAAAPLYLVYTPLLAAKYFVMFGAEAHASLGWYAGAISTFFWLAVLLIPAGLLWILVDRTRRRRQLLVVATLLGGVVATAGVTDTNVRYVLLLVPFAALVGASLLDAVPKLQRPVLALLALVGAWQAGGWWVLERWPALRPLPLRQEPILNIGEHIRWIPARLLLPATAAAPEPVLPPLEGMLTLAADQAQRPVPSINVLDTRRTPTPVEADWLHYLAYRMALPFGASQINAPWIDPHPSEHLLWMSDDPTQYAFVHHVLSTRAGLDLRPQASETFGDGSVAWLFSARAREAVTQAEVDANLPGRLAAGGSEALGPGWVHGLVRARDEAGATVSVLGVPLRVAPAEGARLHPDLVPGVRCWLRHGGAVDDDGAVWVDDSWPAYAPTRFREQDDYPPAEATGEPPAGLPRCHLEGRLRALTPDTLELEEADGTRHILALGGVTQLTGAELSPGAPLCVQTLTRGVDLRRVAQHPDPPAWMRRPDRGLAARLALGVSSDRQLDPTTDPAVARAHALLAAGDHAAAEALLAEHPDTPLVRLGRAWAAANQGRTEAALAGYRAILADDPTHLLAGQGAALALAQLGQDDEAFALLDTLEGHHAGAPELAAMRLVLNRATAPDDGPDRDVLEAFSCPNQGLGMTLLAGQRAGASDDADPEASEP